MAMYTSGILIAISPCAYPGCYRKVGLAPNIAVIAHAPLVYNCIALLVFGSAVTALVLVSSPQFPPLTAVQFLGLNLTHNPHNFSGVVF
jgi:hypothetical protein